MNIPEFIAAQLRKPSGTIGRFFVTRFLNRRNVRMNTLTLEMMQLQSDDTVLEIGFGGGYLIEKMALGVTHGRITGVDFSYDAVEFCRKRFKQMIQTGRIDLHCANIDSLPFSGEVFLKVCTVNTLYFWPDPPAALREVHRVLKQNGTLFIGFTPRVVMEKMKVTRMDSRCSNSMRYNP